MKATLVLAAGLGDATDAANGRYGAEALRRAAGVAARTLHGSTKAGFALPASDAPSIEAVALGGLLGAYTLTALLSKKGAADMKSPLSEIVLLGADSDDKTVRAAVERATVLAEEINRTRDLVNMPPKICFLNRLPTPLAWPARDSA
jgi:leucyl aminopeptidase